MKTYKYATPENLVVLRFDEDGVCRFSCSVENEEYLAWLAEGNAPEPADPIPVPPIIVSPRQIRQALTAMGMRDQVEAAVAAGDQDTKDWWEFATQVEQNHPMVIAMAAALGVSDAQRQALFELAASK